jgi:hypothetical protein
MMTQHIKNAVSRSLEGGDFQKIFGNDIIAFADKNYFKIQPVPLHGFFECVILKRPT